ncbi:hypothetical protein BCR34DRAFT_600617 [Clohesyomyces aquaticus]|uniref:PCI domain-containing protein n=1 Tax=Clohesyomyces aquaticus TaxID=1231657 RepID=A0A1Y1ZQ85_9PLEO|nr:hypothetical protein BCR34DRAFT_600617 [Clohesyomyces aquaticus]
MEAIIEPFRHAHASGDGYAVSALLSPIPPPYDPGRLYAFYRASNEQRIDPELRYALKYSKGSRIPPDESGAWADMFVLYWRAVGEILKVEEGSNQGRLGDRQWVAVYDTWKALTDSIQRYVSNGTLPFWAVVCMYHAASNLRKFAIKADEQLANTKGSVTFNSGFQDDVVDSLAKTEKLEEAARLFNRMFALCLGDRNPDLRESRKWGTYYMANLQFKTYFKLKTINLCKNVVRSIEAQPDLPPLTLFPKAHQATYKYYTGILAFLQENYTMAETLLTEAWRICNIKAAKNQELILTYLIPCRLVAKHEVPNQQLLARFPGLQERFGPLVACIKQGNLAGFDSALTAGEEEFVKRRIYLTLERGRDIALRNLLRRVFLAGGYEELKEGQTEADMVRKSRISLAEFGAALRMGVGGGSGQNLEDDEVECMIANMIYKASHSPTLAALMRCYHLQP